jgi:hypothetical protein
VRAGLVQVARVGEVGVSVGVLLERRPVAQRLEVPLLGEGQAAAADGAEGAVEIAAVIVGQAVQAVVGVEPVSRGGVGVVAVGAVGVAVVAVLEAIDISRRAVVTRLPCCSSGSSLPVVLVTCFHRLDIKPSAPRAASLTRPTRQRQHYRNHCYEHECQASDRILAIAGVDEPSTKPKPTNPNSNWNGYQGD